MTSINSNVFSGLTGAAPALLSRAVALINNSGLTSLEPLRQALADGSTVVRAATAADMVPPGVHATFRDPVRDPQTLAILEPGEIIVRTEYLTSASDPAVLQFVDDILHEGIGHGAQIRVDARARANRDLSENPDGLSTTDRGDAYVKAWIDDETNARYTAYNFRKELATLNTEYSASNRAILATDNTFKELARLDSVASGMGLTGTDKADYVIAQARPVVAAYNNHFYRDAGSNHVIEALHLNGTPEGTAYEAHVKATFNLVGYIVTDVVMHDDNSSSASVIYENGDRRDVVFDSSGNLYQEQRATANGDSTTTRYDASGHPTEVTEVDGAQDNADYFTRTTAYDTQGSVDSIDVRRDDGARDWTDYDQNGSQGWGRVESRFDALGREDYATVFMDDGGRTWVDYDQTNARSDSTWSNHVDALGREDWANITLDDGSRDWYDYDQTNARGDSLWRNRTDAQGREDWRQITMDDGSRTWIDYDQTNTRSDSIWSNRVDAWGREDWTNITLDDGSRDWYDYDQDGSQGWSRVVSHFDASGREDNASMYMDNGSRDWYDYDQDNSQGWSRVVSHFDASGREDNASMYMDNGSRDWYDYDQDSSQGWSRVVSHFDASGREDYATMFLDDGSRNTYDYDQGGSQRWSRMESHFGASGRAEYSTTYNDDGSRLVIDHDYNGHYGEHGIITYSAAGRAHLVGWTRDGYDGLIFTPAGGVIGANGYAGPPPSFGQFSAALPYVPAIYSDPDGDGPSWTIEAPWGVYHGS